MELVSKWSWISWYNYKSWQCPFVQSLGHTLIQTWYPAWQKLIFHIVVPFLQHFLNLPEPILVHHSITTCAVQYPNNYFKFWSRHDVIAFEWVVTRICLIFGPKSTKIKSNCYEDMGLDSKELEKLPMRHGFIQTFICCRYQHLFHPCCWKKQKIVAL